MYRLTIALLLSGLPLLLKSQGIDPVPFASTILASDLKKHLSVLASDEYEGRETGTEGNRKAARYLAAQFQSFGLPAIGDSNSYFQKITLSSVKWENISLESDGKTYRHLWDYYALPNINRDQPVLETKKIVFLGYGIDDKTYSDYKGVKVKNKVLLIYDGEPVDKDSVNLLTHTRASAGWTYEKKLEAAWRKGAKAVLIIDPLFQQRLSEARRMSFGNRLEAVDNNKVQQPMANSLFLSPTLVKTLLGDQLDKVVRIREQIQSSGKPDYCTLKCILKITQKLKTTILAGENVLGYIEGSDPVLKNELVVITAHYDHLGKRGDDTFHGADDDGSGTVSIVEIAEAFAKAKKEGKGPRRSILVMPVTGEEKGLLGSRYYTQFPRFPLQQTVADVNIDMVGRIDAKHKDQPDYIYVIGSDKLSTELHEINERVNATYTKLQLDYTYNDKNDPNRYYYRSDHYNFAEKGIPAIFYFNGTHADYHRPSDTVDKINFEAMEKRARLAFYTAWELANRDTRIKVDVKP